MTWLGLFPPFIYKCIVSWGTTLILMASCLCRFTIHLLIYAKSNWHSSNNKHSCLDSGYKFTYRSLMSFQQLCMQILYILAWCYDVIDYTKGRGSKFQSDFYQWFSFFKNSIFSNQVFWKYLFFFKTCARKTLLISSHRFKWIFEIQEICLYYGFLAES